MANLDHDNLKLTDFMDLPTLQEIQDSFAAVANVKASITDAQGILLTQPAPTRQFLRRQRAIAEAEVPQREGGEYVAPIVVDNQRLGTIRMAPLTSPHVLDEAKLVKLAEKLNVETRQIRLLATQISHANRPAAIQFLFLLANAIARLCFQEYQLRQRVDELAALHTVATMLSEARDLNRVLQRTAEITCAMMGTKASSIRLIDEDEELVIKAVHNLSAEYVGKGRVRLSESKGDAEALSDKGFCYVRDLGSDVRAVFGPDARREGIVSMLCVGMRYKGRPIGVLRVYSAEEQHFSQLQIDLLKAVAAQAAGAIDNARLAAEGAASEALEKQVAMAVAVQQRIVPQRPPTVAGIDVAAAYQPCYELGGDLFDFIELPERNLGLVIADVSGKGVPASLTMAAVRAALRAHVDNIYYLYEVMRRVNLMVHRDTKSGEFVTLFYGVLDTVNLRLTWCNAGHPSPLLLRDGLVSELDAGNLVLGVDPAEQYTQTVVQLQTGDVLLLYTDGVTDALNFQGESWGKRRLLESLRKSGPSAEIIAQNILWDMRRYVGLTERTDDVTMVVARIV